MTEVISVSAAVSRGSPEPASPRTCCPLQSLFPSWGYNLLLVDPVNDASTLFTREGVRRQEIQAGDSEEDDGQSVKERRSGTTASAVPPHLLVSREEVADGMTCKKLRRKAA